MKIKAAILLLCFTSYFVDTIAAVNLMKSTCEKQSSSCPKMMARQAKTNPGKCPSEEKDCEKYCINCPLTIVIIITTSIDLLYHAIAVNKRFPGYETKLTSDFYAKAWKPPKISSWFA